MPKSRQTSTARRDGWRCAVLALCALSSAVTVAAAPPAVTHLFPAGGQRGTKVSVTCAGNFSWPLQVHAPGVETTIAPDSGKIEVAIPADLAADRVWLRLYSAEGASAPVPFLIGSLPEVVEQEPNNSPRQAQPLPEPRVTVNGVLREAADVDVFAVTLAAGQTLVASLDAHSRLGSPMDAILQVATPEGFVLADNNDDVDLDPRLAFAAPRDGTYLVRVFAFSATPDTTIALRGGANYVYRLTLTTGPFVTHAVPLSVPADAPAAVQVMGWNVPEGTRLPAVPFLGERLAEWAERETLADLRNSSDARLGLAFASELAGAARVRVAPLGASAELAQPTAERPVALTLPAAVTGWIRQPRQADIYTLSLRKGQPLVVAAEARSLGLPLDPVLRLTDAAGTTLAEADDPAQVRATLLAHTPAADGEFRLIVKDRFGHGGERSFYRLTARIEAPDFELTTSADSLVVTPDKPAELTVNVQRRAGPDGTVGPITIAAEGLPEGVACAAAISEPTGPSASKVMLTFTSTGPAHSGPIRITGTAATPTPLTRRARTPALLNATFDYLWLTAVGKG